MTQPNGAGRPIDPSPNVLDLVEKEAERQDDLREITDKYMDARLGHLQDMAIVRASCAKEISDLRDEHARELRIAEAGRLNAIRQVDQANVSTAADRAGGAIAALAAQTKTDAETLRSLVASTATTIAAQSAGTVEGMNKRIAALELTAATGLGKQAMSDPAWVELLKEVRNLRQSRDTDVGSNAGSKAMWGYILGGVGLLSALYALLK